MKKVILVLMFIAVMAGSAFAASIYFVKCSECGKMVAATDPNYKHCKTIYMTECSVCGEIIVSTDPDERHWHSISAIIRGSL